MICPVCGREFEPAHHNQRKCVDCKNKVVRSCARCGGRIVVDWRSTARYCHACVQAAKRENLSRRVVTCAVCGREFTPTLAAQKKCTDCYNKTRATCQRCGASYICGTSSRSRYCPACRNISAAERRTGSFRAATTDFAAMRKAYALEHREEMLASASRASAAARQSPIAGPFETNLNAKIWTLCDPSGNLHNVTNLALFVRGRPDDFPRPKSALHMLYKQSACLRDGRRVTPQTCCGGWYVVDAPLVTQASIDHAQDLANKRQRRTDYLAGKRQQDPPSTHQEPPST